jgi:hypothetical protein
MRRVERITGQLSLPSVTISSDEVCSHEACNWPDVPMGFARTGVKPLTTQCRDIVTVVGGKLTAPRAEIQRRLGDEHCARSHLYLIQEM